MSIIAPLLLALLQPTAGAPGPSITHERVGENIYKLRLIVPTAADGEAASRLLDRTVSSLCGALHPRFGRWEMREAVPGPGSTAPAPPAELIQEIICETEPAPAAETAAPTLVDPAWTASVADEQAVRAGTDAFFGARDDGRFPEAFALLAPNFGGGQTLEEFTAANRAFNQENGRKIARRLAGVTWYNNNLSGAPPGIYAAVDFVADYEALHFSCGYLIWQLQPDRSWRIVTVNQTVVRRSSAPDASAEELAEMWAHSGCRN